jgi:hypothetical protein
MLRRRKRHVNEVNVRIVKQGHVVAVRPLDQVLTRVRSAESVERDATAAMVTSSRRLAGRMIAAGAIPAAPRIPTFSTVTPFFLIPSNGSLVHQLVAMPRAAMIARIFGMSATSRDSGVRYAMALMLRAPLGIDGDVRKMDHRFLSSD